MADVFLSPDFFTGWGLRTVAVGESRYNPLSYHNGSVWPHDNSLIASGLAKYGFKEQAGKVLLGLLDLSNQVDLRRLPELFCGLDRRPGEGPTLYPVACSPQAWAAGSVFLILQACLGITVSGTNQRVEIRNPYLPAGIPQLWIKGLRSGEACVDLFFERRGNVAQVQIAEEHGDIDVIVHYPRLPAATQAP
jgi:glycogen debranching enzyme